MRMHQNNGSDDPADRVGYCDECGKEVYRYRGDDVISCDTPTCPAIYNSGGQRLRDNLFSMPNRSEHDDDIGDMEGYEMACLAEERGDDW